MKVGLIGKNGAGKSVVCEYLKQKGFQVLSLSDIVRDHARKKGRGLSRDELIQTANEIKAEHGLNYLAAESLKRISDTQVKHVAFDSIRNRDEVVTLKKGGVIMIGVEAPLELRYERIKSRGGATDHVDFETFKEQDERESSGKSSGQNINDALMECDFLLNNDQEEADLYAAIDMVIENISSTEAVCND